MFISSVVALSDFFIKNFPHISWYPYWYLGNPYRFLIGPVIPAVLFLFKVFRWSTTASYYLLIFASFFIGAAGVYALVKALNGEKRETLYSSLFFLIFPFSLLLLLFQNGLYHITFAFLPWILVLLIKFINLPAGPLHQSSSEASRQEKTTAKNAILLSIAIVFVLLIDVSILLRILIGSVVLLFVFKPSKERVEQIIIYLFLLILLSLSLSTFWYTPSFWWVLLSNPSFGGKPLGQLITFLFELALNIIPIVFAVTFVKWRNLKLSKPLLFGILFFVSFLFLTIVRFLSDPDFVMDWIGFALELQFGGVIILGSMISKLKSQNSKVKSATQNSKLAFLGIITFIVFIGWVLVVRNLDSIRSRSGYQERIVSMLYKIQDTKYQLLNTRIFLSGSPVFFINEKTNILQVRGGADQASVNSSWADAAYQIREGESADLAQNWLSAVGSSYILVHGRNSEEPFHDFKHPEKFGKFELISQNGNDFLYKVPKVDLARVADKSILKDKRPRNGADQDSLSAYVKTIKRPIQVLFEKPDKIVITGKIEKNEVISLAVSFDPDWKVIQGKASILSDSLGNIVLVPKIAGDQKIILFYSINLFEYLIPAIFSLALLVLLLKFKYFYPRISKPLHHLSLGFKEEDEVY